MKYILSFAGSNSSTSINHQVLEYVRDNFQDDDIKFELVRLIDYDFPIYSMDTEKSTGIPNDIKKLFDKIKQADGVILSVAEHNSQLVAYFKSIIDWLSRLDRDFIRDKNMMIMSVSPGGRGAASAQELAVNMFNRFGAQVINTLSVPNFYKTFLNGELTDSAISAKLKVNIVEFNNLLKRHE